jgi:hypothetical protein
MAARFDWAVPTILGNADEPVLDTDVATKAYVDASGGNTGNITFDQSTIESDQSNAFINFNSANTGVLALGTNNAANVVVVADAGNVNSRWTFDTTGNLTLPASTSSINYANGSPYGGGGSSITNGNSSVVVNPSNVRISANAVNNFQFGTDTQGTILSLNPNNSSVQNIRAINQVSGIGINESALFTFDGIFPYDGPEILGNATMPWNSITAYGIVSLGNITTDGFVSNTSNITTMTANTANITTLNTTGGNINANTANITTLNTTSGNINANTFTANSVSTPKLFQNNTVGQFTCGETAVAANTTIVIPWANGTVTSTDFNFISVGGVPTGGVRNISTDTLVVSVTGSILWNQNSNTQATRITTIYLNDTIQVIEQDAIPTGSNYAGQSFSTVMLLAPNQYVSVTARNDSGGSANVGGAISGIISAPTNKLNITVLARKVP